MATQEELDNWYAYHAPSSDQVAVYEQIRAKGKELAELLNASVKDCADKSYAHRELRNTIMAINLAVACNPTE